MTKKPDAPNLTAMNFSSNETKAALEKLKRGINEVLELARIQAQIKRESFNALKAQGFTDEQALELCKNPLS